MALMIEDVDDQNSCTAISDITQSASGLDLVMTPRALENAHKIIIQNGRNP